MPVLIRYGQTVLRISTVLSWNLNYFSTLYKDTSLINGGCWVFIYFFFTTNLSILVQYAEEYCLNEK